MHSTQNPWLKTSLQYRADEIKLNYGVPHDVFSGQQIDEGTILLLANLPTSNPQSILDMGCGYGALGLPVAAKFRSARVEMVDRDLLAVDWSARNANENQLTNVDAYGSLGYRDLKGGRDAKYDWILCNVPARIGTPFIENLITEGRILLAENGDLRVVVIRDLCPVLNDLREKHQWPLKLIAEGPRHSVFSIGRGESQSIEPENVDLYLRDQVEVQGTKYDRPFDLGGDDPKRLKAGLPVLMDALPRQISSPTTFQVMAFRCGYGVLPITCKMKWPEAHVTAVDRDLLATTFILRNVEKLKLLDSKFAIRENAYFYESLGQNEKFDLILGEISPSTSEKVAEAELAALSSHLKKGGEALLLCLDKIEKQWIRPAATKLKLKAYPVITRDGYTVVRVNSLQ